MRRAMHRVVLHAHALLLPAQPLREWPRDTSAALAAKLSAESERSDEESEQAAAPELQHARSSLACSGPFGTPTPLHTPTHLLGACLMGPRGAP